MNARDLVRLLANRHHKDIGIGECKTGSSWYGAPVRLDYWAMKPSWAKWMTWGYEVKVNRQDFVRDTKWREYLDFCHEFYFVAPPGVISRDELPPEAGLLEASKNATRLYTRKKAPHRDVEIQRSILIYALMWRSDRVEGRDDNAASWRAWLEKKRDYHDLGRSASREMRKLAERAIREIEVARLQHEREAEKYEDLRKWLDEQGLHLHDWRLTQKIRDRLDGQEVVEAREAVRAARRALTTIAYKLDEWRGTTDE